MSLRSWIDHVFPRHTHRKNRNPRARELRFELLEDRIVLNSYMAANATELMAAIDASNLIGGANTITLTAASSSPYTLTAVQNSYSAPTGLPVVFTGNNLTIIGNGGVIQRSMDAATPAFRLLDVATGASLALKNLVLQGGSAPQGGAIHIAAGASVTMVNSTIANSTSSTDGGAIFNDGTLDISNSTIWGSQAAQGRGGAIFNDGTLTLSNSTIANNQAGNGGGGLFNDGALTITASTIAYNTCTSSDTTSFGGGGIFCTAPKLVALSSSIITGNGDNSVHRDPDIGGGYYDSHGYNLIGTIGINWSYASNWKSTDQIGLRTYGHTPYLTSLGNSGGPTPTIAVLPGSPAIGRGDPSLASGVDQRGVSRNQRFGVDCGAFQSRGFQLSLVVGNYQSAVITTPFATPLTAKVSSSFGDPIAGGIVFFSASSATNGASAVTNPAGIDSSGLVTATAVANNLAGSYQITASSIGMDPLPFNLTNTPAPTSVDTSMRWMVCGSVDQSITLSAVVSSPAVVNGGMVTFSVFSGSTPIGAPLPPCPVSFGYASTTFTLPGGTPPGNYNIVATYAPSANYIGSSNNARIGVLQAATKTTTTFAFAPGSTSDQTIPLSALVTATTGAGPINTGTVTFQIFKGTTQIGAAVSGPVQNGKASVNYVLPGGTAVDSYTIVATYNANSNYASSSDSAHTLDVGLTGIVTNDVFVGVSPNNQTLMLTAQVLTPSPDVLVNGGTVTFRLISGGTRIGNDAISGPVTNNIASATYVLPGGTPTGSYTIVAIYNPNPDFVGSIDATHQLTVGVTRVTMGMASQAAIIGAGDLTVPLIATVTPESGSGTVNEGTVTFRLLSQDGTMQFGTALTSGTVTNGIASVSYVVPAGTPVGAYKVLAVYNPSPLYFTSAKTAPFQLLSSMPAQRTKPTVTINPTGGTYNGTPITVTASALDLDGKSLVAGAISITYYAQNPPSGPPLATAPTNAGSYTVVVKFTSYNLAFDDATVSFPFTIDRATPTVKFNSTGGTYNGNPIPASAQGFGVDGKPLTGNFTFNYYSGLIPAGQPLPSAPIDVGTYTAIAFFSGTDPNYGGGAARSTFVINPPPPTITDFSIPVNGAEGSPLSLSASAANPYSQLDYTWTITRPDSSTFTLAGDHTSFTPPDNGTYGISVTVTAADGTSATRAGSIAVANVAPTITSFTIPATGTKSYALTFNATATDPAAANDPLTCSWTITRPDQTTSALTGASPTYTPADSGLYSISLTVSDGDGGADSRTSFLYVYTRAASTKFVQGLYQLELGRIAGQSEVTFWVNVFDGTNGQTGAASGIVSSTEARVRVVSNWFQTYLGRTPSAAENNFWAPLLAGQSEEQVLSQLLGSTEFFNRAQGMGFGGTANQNFVRALYQLLLSRAASNAEVDAQVTALAQTSQTAVSLALLQSVEYRANTVRGYYTKLLGRAGSQAEIASQVNSGRDLRAIRIGIESSVEFFNTNASKSPTIATFTVPSLGTAASAVAVSGSANNAAGNFYALTYTWTISKPNGTLLTTLTGASSSFTPPDNGNYGVRLTVTDEDGYSTSQSATVAISIAAPTSAIFNYSAPVHSLTLGFSSSTTLTLADLTVKNLTTGAVISPSAMMLAFAHNPETATLSFIGLPNGTLPDGRYRLTIPSAGNYTFDFFGLAGDVNRDASVGFADLVAIAQNYGTAGKSYAQGDVNRDSAVDFADLVLVAQNYGTILSASPVPSSPVVASPTLAPVFSTISIRKTSPPKALITEALAKPPTTANRSRFKLARLK